MAEHDRLTIIKLWDFLLLPLQGDITDELANRLRQQVLDFIQEWGADGLVIDVTGVWMIDSHLCSVISTLAASARLMGAESIVCGMSPDIALTLQTMGVELERVRTALTVEEAFEALGIGRAPAPVKAAAQRRGKLSAPGTQPTTLPTLPRKRPNDRRRIR